MKQVITRDQWLELTDRQQAKALSWLKGRFENAFTVGMMIEFLSQNDTPMVLVKRSQWHGGMWDITATGEVKNLTLDEMEKAVKHKESTELCDALWEAVKEIVSTYENNKR